MEFACTEVLICLPISIMMLKKCIEMLKPEYGRYAGIVVDIFFDHFLAANWNQYSANIL